MESKKRLDLTMGEFVAEWGDVETIRNHLKELAHAAIRREQEIRAALAANRPWQLWQLWQLWHNSANLHRTEVWEIIIFLADMLQNSPDAANLCARLNRNGVISQTRQQPFHPTAGILWHDTRLKRCDYISQQMMRKKEAKRLFWERKIVSRKRKREPGD